MRRLFSPSSRSSSALALVLFPLLLGSTSTTPTPSRPAAAPGAPFVGASDDASRRFVLAAIAMRRGDCAGARTALDPLLALHGADAVRARLVAGLQAYACEQVALAEDRLFSAADPGSPLEDWRLYVLADSAAANGHVLVAQAAVAKLLGDYPASPLRPRAMVKAATLAWQQGDARRALEIIDSARREDLGGAEGTRLESLAWEIGAGAEPGARLAAARRLLTRWPAEAARLQVVELFRRTDGGIDWTGVLTAEQLAQRARALLALNLFDSALQTLDAVGPADRQLPWSLLKADVLTRAHRGLEAMSMLSTLTAPPGDPELAARLEWARAMAADDVATAQRGRANLVSADRQQFRLVAQQHLRRVVDLGGDKELAKRALRSLYSDLAEAELFDRSIDVLRELRKLDPADDSGAANLWELGWREYGRRNYTGAVGYWTELFDLYPENSNARRGRYWAARAFGALGEAERARQIFGELASADTDDFYRRNALVRLRSTPGARPASPILPAAVQPWPDDPSLSRARLLSDLGLDDLAVSEIDLAREHADSRAMTALEALVLARKGERRKSMLVIRNAFPALGGPFQAALPEQARKLYYPLAYEEPIRTWAQANGLPPYLIYGIIRQESAFDPGAQSWAGARGLMQLMPATARELAGKAGLAYSSQRLADPAFNLQLGTTYFRQVLAMFDGDVQLALAGYNGGPYRIQRLWHESGTGEIDTFLEGLGLEEPKTYVKRILVLSDSYRQLYPQAG